MYLDNASSIISRDKRGKQGYHSKSRGSRWCSRRRNNHHRRSNSRRRRLRSHSRRKRSTRKRRSYSHSTFDPEEEHIVEGGDGIDTDKGTSSKYSIDRDTGTATNASQPIDVEISIRLSQQSITADNLVSK